PGVPADFAREVAALGHVDGGRGVAARRREPMDFERFCAVEVAELGPVPVRRNQQVPGRIRKLVQQDECTLAPVDDELLPVVALRRAAEHAAVLLIGTRDVLEAPRRPEALYSHFFQRKKPSMAPTTTTM